MYIVSKIVELIHPKRLQNNIELDYLPVFNSGGDNGKRSFIEELSGQFFWFSFYHGGYLKEILAFLLVALYLTLLLGLCCIILVLRCSHRRAEHTRSARLANIDQ